MSRLHWVVIETGSNQALVFRTNKQRLNVAASRLIWSVGFEWIPQAIDEVGDPHVEHVVKASGLGVLLASPETGRKIIEAVTTRGVMEAPDLEVWGVVGDTDVSDNSGIVRETGIGLALGGAQRAAASWRPYRRSAQARDQNLPYTQTCAFTGYPASTSITQGERDDLVSHAVSSGTAALWRSSAAQRDRLVERLQAAVPEDLQTFDSAVVSTDDLDADGVENNGWVGILHADGNGIGDIFTNLRHVYDGRRLIDRLSAMSEILERCAWQAVAEAIVDTDDAIPAEMRTRRGWMLPILVGGDDITLVVHGGYAFEFALALTNRFDAQLNAQDLVLETLADIRRYQAQSGIIVTAPQRISLATGLVFTKPKHPFSHGVQLAEDLTKSAKSVKQHEVSAIDVHVLHESSVRRLADVRADLTHQHGVVRMDLWAGPVVLSPDPPNHLEPRSMSRLLDAIDCIRGPAGGDQDRVPSGILHDLRQELTSPGAYSRLHTIADRIQASSQQRPYKEAMEQLLGEHLSESHDSAEFSRILTAMDLADVAHGTAFARSSAIAAGVNSDA